jgi:hypothetical protein
LWFDAFVTWFIAWFFKGLDTDIISIAQFFAFANSLISLAIIQILGRKALIRWRNKMFISLTLLWVGVFPCLLYLIISMPILAGIIKVGIIFWIFGLVLLLYVIYKIITLDLITFKKPPVKFPKFGGDFGVPCFDKLLDEAKNLDRPRPIYYPFLLVADEYCRPWRICEKFLLRGLSQDYGGIYFAFTRPAPYVYEHLKRKASELNLDLTLHSEKLVIIDCYTKLASQVIPKRGERNCNNYTILEGNPRKPQKLNEKYEKALRILKQRKCEGVRVVYEALSDFVFLTDKEIAVQYLRHNMVWEEENNVESLYVLRPGVVKKELEEQIMWFSNTTFYLKAAKDLKSIDMEVRGLFYEPRKYSLDFMDFTIKN